MKLAYALFILIVVFTIPLQAQTLISFSGGPNLPGGDLASQNTETLGSGYAKRGITLNVSVAKLLYKKFGLISNLRYQRNNFNKTELQSPIAIVTAHPWQSVNLSLGPFYELRLLPKIYLSLFVQAGYLRTAARTLHIENVLPYYSDQNSYTNIDQKAAGAFSTIYGFDLRYELFNKLCLGIEFDYLASTQYFKAVYSRNWQQKYERNREYKMDMQSFNAQFKISYKIKRSDKPE